MGNANKVVALRRLVHCALMVFCMVLGLGLAASTLAADGINREALYEQAKELLRQGQAEQAYQLLAAKEGDLSGDDAYDYLLGVAALDSQNPGEAIFSLQRLVSSNPDFSGARLELARAYFDIGDNELARIEFDRIMTENPPPNVLAAVINYQDAIKARASAYSSSSQFYFETGGGYDSNAPAATDEQLFLGFLLSDNNLAQDSSYADLAAGGYWNRPLSKTSQIMLTARLDHRSNASTHFVDASNLDVGAIWNWKKDDNGFSLAVNNLLSAVDRKYSRRDNGLTMTYTRQAGASVQLAAFARAGISRFNDAALSVRDVNQAMVGLSLNKSFAASQVSLSLTGNSDTTVDSAAPFSTDGYGVSLSNIWFGAAGAQYTLSANLSKTKYDDAYFGLARQDDVYGLSATGVWLNFPGKDWMTTARLGYSMKDSTVSLFEFNRIDAGVTFRKMFD
jgi:tetratricopeptide (TPR) repeat protein